MQVTTIWSGNVQRCVTSASAHTRGQGGEADQVVHQLGRLFGPPLLKVAYHIPCGGALDFAAERRDQ